MPLARDETIAVRGLGPLIRDLSKVSKTATRALRRELRLLAEPVKVDIALNEAEHARGRSSVQGVKVIVRQRGINVEQTRRKSTNVTLRRPNFGPLQQTEDFNPGLAANREFIADQAEAFIHKFLNDTIEGSLF